MPQDSNMMPVLTGVVFAVVLGMTVQNSDGLVKAFSPADQIEATDDVFFVRAGANAALDVLANDKIKTTTSQPNIEIVAGPLCGEVVPSAGGITYLNSDACQGPVHFTYCLGEGESCTPAEVKMNVRPAPLAVVDAYMPEKGDLVPLPLPVFTKDENSAAKSETGQPAPLHAFVVTLAPKLSGPALSKSEMSRFLIDMGVSDLDKMPTVDHANLRTVDIPLSALRTARFLADYSEYDGTTKEIAGQPLSDLEGIEALKDQIEIDEETVQIELMAPSLVSSTDQG